MSPGKRNARGFPSSPTTTIRQKARMADRRGTVNHPESAEINFWGIRQSDAKVAARKKRFATRVASAVKAKGMTRIRVL